MFKQQMASVFIAASVVCAIVPQMAMARGPIESDMKDMKHAFKAAMAADAMPEFITQFNQFKTTVLHAAQLPYTKGAPSDAKVYQTGMDKLKVAMQAVDAAILKNDLTAAKNALQQLRDLQKEYHQKLDV